MSEKLILGTDGYGGGMCTRVVVTQIAFYKKEEE